MCLCVPGRVIAVDGSSATVDFWGVRREVRLELVDEAVAPGDYVLNHVGYAIRRIPAADVAATLTLYEDLLELSGQGDLMAADLGDEIGATKGPPDDGA